MAGNIIPAIATTNAIIAGFIVMQALSLLKRKSAEATKATDVYLRSIPHLPLAPSAPVPPNESCAVCRDTYIPFKADVSRCTLGEVLDAAKSWLQASLGEDELECSILEGARVLADPDFDDNHSRTLKDLDIERGKMITLMDEDDKYRPIHFCLLEPEANAEAALSFPETAPALALKPVQVKERSESPEVELVEAASRKRSEPDSGHEDQPSKKRKTETEEPEVVVDDGDDDDDIIIIE
jgi:ubiquitin-like 1-activating enzyme E1 B